MERRRTPLAAAGAGIAAGGLAAAAMIGYQLAPPVWEQPAAEVALDASYHFVYGLALATCFRLLYR